MINKTVLNIVAVALLILFLCGSCSASECTNGYAEYKPVFGNNSGGPGNELYVIDESRVDAGHYERIKLIFEFYEVNYQVIDGKVWVDCNMWANKDYMMNMTKKAESAAEFCKLIRNNFDKFQRDIYGNTPEMLEMCDSMGL